ncbi:hypothetical protein ACWDCL_06105 [Streptomyces sp. NPDC001009]
MRQLFSFVTGLEVICAGCKFDALAVCQQQEECWSHYPCAARTDVVMDTVQGSRRNRARLVLDAVVMESRADPQSRGRCLRSHQNDAT